jgi:hypothetical protein
MRRWIALAALALAAGAAIAPPALAAPTLDVTRQCAYSRQTVNFAGTGYKKDVPYRFTMNGRTVLRARTTTTGDIAGLIRLPRISRATGQRGYVLRATDGTGTGVTRVYVTTLSADFAPRLPKSIRSRVTFTVRGMLRRFTTAYLHYIRPNGTVRATVNLGRTSGPCGRIAARRQLFPFVPTAGRWRLQFDLRPTYSRVVRPKPFVRISLPIVRRTRAAR